MQTLAHLSLRRKLSIQHGGEGARRPDDDPMVEGVYDRLKHWLHAQVLVPGQLLQIGVLAEELGVSTTPIREALTRLAAERLIDSAPKKGFFAKTPSEDEIRGLYSINQVLLDSALSNWPHRNGVDDSREWLRIASGLSSLEAQNPRYLTECTAELFFQIAVQSGVAEMADLVRNMSDRLYHARIIECDLLEVREELARMSSLYANRKGEELRGVLKDYHQKRLQVLSAICKELLFRPFASSDR